MSDGLELADAQVAADLTTYVARARTLDADVEKLRAAAFDASKDFQTKVDEAQAKMTELAKDLAEKGEEPVAFDHDCREGICGTCSLMINGEAHGPERTTTCQLHMRSFRSGETITIEPWRANAFPVIRDLVTDVSFNYEKAAELPYADLGPRDADGRFARRRRAGSGAPRR